jgi:hypothetical protein
LRDELKQEIEATLEIHAIETLNDDTEGHLQNCEDHSQLHLEVVREGEELLALEPSVVSAESIDTILRRVRG